MVIVQLLRNQKSAVTIQLLRNEKTSRRHTNFKQPNTSRVLRMPSHHSVFTSSPKIHGLFPGLQRMFPFLWRNHGTMEIFHGKILKRDSMHKIQTVFWWGKVKVSLKNMHYLWVGGVVNHFTVCKEDQHYEVEATENPFSSLTELLSSIRTTSSHLMRRDWLPIVHIQGWHQAKTSHWLKVWMNRRL